MRSVLVGVFAKERITWALVRQCVKEDDIDEAKCFRHRNEIDEIERAIGRPKTLGLESDGFGHRKA